MFQNMLKIYWKHVLECLKIGFEKNWKKLKKSWKKVEKMFKKVEKCFQKVPDYDVPKKWPEKNTCQVK